MRWAPMWPLFVTLEWGWGPALILSCVLTAIINVGFDRDRAGTPEGKNTPSIAALISTVIFLLVQNLLMIVFGSERKPFPKIFDFPWKMRPHPAGIPTEFGDCAYPCDAVCIYLLIYRTNIRGLSMRGTEQNACGRSWWGDQRAQCHNLLPCPSGISAALAAFLVAGYYNTVYPTMGVQIALKAFASSCALRYRRAPWGRGGRTGGGGLRRPLPLPIWAGPTGRHRV